MLDYPSGRGFGQTESTRYAGGDRDLKDGPWKLSTRRVDLVEGLKVRSLPTKISRKFQDK